MKINFVIYDKPTLQTRAIKYNGCCDFYYGGHTIHSLCLLGKMYKHVLCFVEKYDIKTCRKHLEKCYQLKVEG